MAAGLISEDDTQKAIARLRPVLSVEFCRQFFGRDTLDRLERIVGQQISHHFLLDLIVRRQGPQLLAERPRRIGPRKTSVRRKLLEALSDGALATLHEQILDTSFTSRRATEERLAEFNWHRGTPKAVKFSRAVGLPDAFAGIRTRPPREKSYEISPIGELPALKPYQRGILREVRDRLKSSGRVMVSSFTGTGKTRLGMEYVIDVLLGDEQRPVVLWIAQKRELLDQACDSIEQLWPWRAERVNKFETPGG